MKQQLQLQRMQVLFKTKDLDYARQIFNHIVEALELDDAEEIVTFTNNVSDLTLNPNMELRATGKLIERRIQDRVR